MPRQTSIEALTESLDRSVHIDPSRIPGRPGQDLENSITTPVVCANADYYGGSFKNWGPVKEQILPPEYLNASAQSEKSPLASLHPSAISESGAIVNVLEANGLQENGKSALLRASCQKMYNSRQQLQNISYTTNQG